MQRFSFIYNIVHCSKEKRMSSLKSPSFKGIVWPKIRYLYYLFTPMSFQTCTLKKEKLNTNNIDLNITFESRSTEIIFSCQMDNSNNLKYIFKSITFVEKITYLICI